MNNHVVKIAFLDYSNVFAGAERVLYNAIAHLDRSKYKPVIIFPYPMQHQKRYATLDCEKLYLVDSLKWWMGSDRWKRPLRGTDFLKRSIFGYKIASFIRKNHIDILDVNLMRSDIMMWVWASRKFTSAKIIGHYRSQEQEWVAPGVAQKLFHMIACVSKFSRMRFRLKGDFTKTSVLYDSVDVDIFKSNKTKKEAKQELGYDENCKLLVSVGQLSLHKGHDNAIRAFSKIVKEFPDARLLIAGGGNKKYADYYRSLVDELELADKVSVPGIQTTDIQTVYRAADLTLSLTKVGEGFGLVPYESALMGTPFIAPNFGAIIEFVQDMQNGLLVNTNNIDEVANKVIYALNNPDETAIMVNRLTKTIKQKLHPQVLADNLDKLYSSL